MTSVTTQRIQQLAVAPKPPHCPSSPSLAVYNVYCAQYSKYLDVLQTFNERMAKSAVIQNELKKEDKKPKEKSKGKPAGPSQKPTGPTAVPVGEASKAPAKDEAVFTKVLTKTQKRRLRRERLETAFTKQAKKMGNPQASKPSVSLPKTNTLEAAKEKYALFNQAYRERREFDAQLDARYRSKEAKTTVSMSRKYEREAGGRNLTLQSATVLASGERTGKASVVDALDSAVRNLEAESNSAQQLMY